MKNDDRQTDEELRKHCKHSSLAVIGMNGVGKSRFGKKIASKVGMKRIDVDTVFKLEHGDIRHYINRYGIEDFRKQEAQIVLDSLRPGNLVILSGGAIESEEVRQALKKSAVVIWLKAGSKKVVNNLHRAKATRHEFAGKKIKEVASYLLNVRNPMYARTADIVISHNIPYSRHAPVAMEKLREYFASQSSED